MRVPYPVPRILEIRGPKVSGEIALRRVLASDSPLNMIPNPFRWFLKFKMNPRRVWAASQFELRVESDVSDGAAVTTLSGEGVSAREGTQTHEF